jgi:hypothetical protein
MILQFGSYSCVEVRSGWNLVARLGLATDSTELKMRTTPFGKVALIKTVIT